MTPSLRLKLRLLQDELKPDVILEASYISNLGEIIASGSDGKGTVNVRAVLNGNNLTGEIVNSNGRLGGFSVVKKSNEVNALSSDQEREFFNLVRAKYQNLAGTYSGVMKSNGNIVSDFPVEIEFNMIEEVVAGKAEVRIKASYRRPDLINVGAERLLNVAVRFSDNISNNELSMSEDPASPGAGGGNRQFLSISGTLNEETGQFTGKLLDCRGQLGTLTLKKK